MLKPLKPLHPFLCCVLFSMPVWLCAQLTVIPADSFQAAVSQSNTPESKVDALHQWALYEIEHSYKLEVASGLLMRAISTAELEGNSRLTVDAYLYFLRAPEIAASSAESPAVIQKLSKLAEVLDDDDQRFEAWKALCLACDARGLACAEEYAEKAVLSATRSKILVHEVEADILKGLIFCNNNYWELAYSFFSNAAIRLLDLSPADRLVTERWLFNEMAHFFKSIGDPEMSAKYNLDARKALIAIDPSDSLALAFNTLNHIEFKYLGDHSYPVNAGVEELLDFADRHQLERLKHYTLSFYRTCLIEREDLEGIRSLFMIKQPKALPELEQRSRFHYHSILAYIEEARADIPAADVQWQQAMSLTKEEDNVYQQLHAALRYAQFLVRNDREGPAATVLETALETLNQLSDESLTETFRRDASRVLLGIYSRSGQTEKALKYAMMHHEYDIKTQQRLDKSLIIKQGAHEHEMNQRIAEIKEYEKKRKHNLQYWIILILVFALFLALVIASSLRVPKWVIQVTAFFSILAMVEFVLILLDKQVMAITGGQPLGKFFIKVGILTFLYPLHHLIEHQVTEYMLRNKLLGKPRWTDFKKALGRLWPWMRDEDEHH